MIFFSSSGASLVVSRLFFGAAAGVCRAAADVCLFFGAASGTRRAAAGLCWAPAGTCHWSVRGIICFCCPSGRGTVYILRPRGFCPTSTNSPSPFVTSTVLCLNTTVQPFSVSLPSDNNGSTNSLFGNLWHFLASSGNPWKLIISVAVETSWPPLAQVTVIPWLVGFSLFPL